MSVAVRIVNLTKRFKQDFKRTKRGVHGDQIDEMLREVLTQLMADKALAVRYRDHPMKGRYIDCRDCHLRSDLVLIYRKIDADTLSLVRIGTHAQLDI